MQSPRSSGKDSTMQTASAGTCIRCAHASAVLGSKVAHHEAVALALSFNVEDGVIARIADALDLVALFIERARFNKDVGEPRLGNAEHLGDARVLVVSAAQHTPDFGR